MNSYETPPSFWKTVGILLHTARKRATGRQRRQRELLNNRARKSTFDWSTLGLIMGVLVMAVIHGMAAVAVNVAVESAQRTQPDLSGKIVVSQQFLNSVNRLLESQFIRGPHSLIFPDYDGEARRIARRTGESPKQVHKRILDSIALHDTRDLISEDAIAPGLKALPRTGRLPAMAGSAVLFIWILMLVCQGEGLELDIQRRRHPMWEWLYSHPIPSGAIFLSEMLSPLAANPIYWAGPVFAGVMYGLAYRDLVFGLIAALLIGIPITVACACLGKALEVAILLRLPPRTRGGLIGLMSWAGYASMMLFFAAIYILPKLVPALARFLSVFTLIPWPWLGLFLGVLPSGKFSFPLGLTTCWAAAALAIAGSVAFSVWGTKRGLAGQFAKADAAPSANRKGVPSFGREPLYRKEFLWFVRDRSAIVQTILIPITLAGYQAFNLRFLTAHASEAWNYLSGAAILFGTYFLWVLGPKSLASEGSALWIALTWPRGLESLLKAKAWLWTLISSALVGLVLIAGCFLFPRDIWKIALVAIAWYFFGHSMAQKSVTLVTITAESGEVQKVSSGRRLASQLGMLTFAIGICTQQWHLAIMGIVYSYITAAAMWQNFRARLPYLYDPWSETLPAPPTLMHAMISISILIEVGAIATGFVQLAIGFQNIGIAQAFSYGICSVAVMAGVTHFLSNRDITADHVWLWKPPSPPRPAIGAYNQLSIFTSNAPPPPAEPFLRRYSFNDNQLIPALLAGAAGGLALGLLGRAYQYLLAHLPATHDLLQKSQQQIAHNAELRISYFVMAVFFAPFAEEFLFRGLLFRSLDREWNPGQSREWRAWLPILGSAAFFAIYHPVLAWPPVFLVGAANAYLFKKTGKLYPCVLLHMLYNAVVLS